MNRRRGQSPDGRTEYVNELGYDMRLVHTSLKKFWDVKPYTTNQPTLKKLTVSAVIMKICRSTAIQHVYCVP